MELSPLLAELAQYPFARLDDWRADARSRGIDVIDFGVGDPREPTPAFIREALIGAIPEVSSYPRAVGLPAYREAVAGVDRPALRRRGRSGGRDRADARVEGGDLLVRAGRARRGPRRRDPEPAYPVYERGALFAGARVRRGAAARGARLAAGSRRVRPLGRARASSGRATRTTRPARPPRSRSTRSSPALAREHGFLLCSDEAYSELWFGDEPVSALQVADRENVVVFNTLSKRSSMTGYPLRLRLRSAGGLGCAAGVPAVGRARRRRSSSSGPGSPRSATRSTCATCARCTGASATRSCPCSSAKGCGSPAATRRSSSGSRSTAARRRSRAGCSTAGSSSRRARSSARTARVM